MEACISEQWMDWSVSGTCGTCVPEQQGSEPCSEGCLQLAGLAEGNLSGNVFLVESSGAYR